MNPSSFRTLVCIIIVAMLGACSATASGPSTATLNETALNTATESASSTPDLSATAVDSATDSASSIPSLSETVLEGKKQVFSLNYPKGWVTDASKAGVVLLANDQDLLKAILLNSTNIQAIKPGQIIVSVQMVSTAFSPFGIKHGDVIGFLKQLTPPPSGDIVFDDPKAIKLGSLDVAQNGLTAKAAQGVAYGFWLDSPVRKYFPWAVFRVFVVTAPNELSKQQALVEAIVLSVKLLQ